MWPPGSGWVCGVSQKHPRKRPALSRVRGPDCSQMYRKAGTCLGLDTLEIPSWKEPNPTET